MAPLTGVKCAITGKPAKYRDPLTGLPYHDLAAFKVIREQHSSEAAIAHRKAEPGSGIGEGAATPDKGGGTGGSGGGRLGHEGAGAKRQRGEEVEGGDDERDILVISRQKLEQIDGSEVVQAMLKDSALREMIKAVDNASDRVIALHSMREENPKFNILMLQVLEILEPSVAK